MRTCKICGEITGHEEVVVTNTQRASKLPLQVAVFSDYICPFCYVGSTRLERLRDEFDLTVDWRSMEIHPDNPLQVRPVEELGYPPERWQKMMAVLHQMAREEGLHIVKRTFTTNSHKALLLAEAAKEEGEDVFYRLHNRLFEAYLSEGQNIGDVDVLRTLAYEVDLPAEAVERAWQEQRYEMRLKQTLAAAARLGVTGTPTFVFERRVLVGAVPTSMLQEAARQSSGI